MISMNKLFCDNQFDISLYAEYFQPFCRTIILYKFKPINFNFSYG